MLSHMTDDQRDLLWRGEWTEIEIEHLALRAAEVGDTATESLCDDALGGRVDAAVVANLARSERDYTAWMERGAELGWRSRDVS